MDISPTDFPMPAAKDGVQKQNKIKGEKESS
jgi:hypothetical protein